jgi:hypothetical protein
MNHAMDALPMLRLIIDKLEAIKLSIVKNGAFDYKSQDARLVALDSIQVLLSSTGMWINAFNSLANFCTQNDRLNEKLFLHSLGSGLTINQTEKVMLDQMRLSQITFILFKLEKLFWNLLAHLKMLPQKSRPGFYDLISKILDVSDIQDEIYKKAPVALSYIRNSLHNNGIHRGKDFEFTTTTDQYHLIKNEVVRCASWSQLLNLIDLNIDLVGKILQSENIQGIDVLIEDRYSKLAEIHENPSF